MSELVPLLNVEDVGSSIAFYETVLGARVENQWEMEGRVRWARLSFAGGSLMLNTPDSTSSSDRKERPDFADVVLYLMCDDAAELRTKLVTAGVAPGELQAEDYGNDEFSLRDPDGYSIRFSSPRA